jgi:copper homeostasis protein
VLTSGGCPTAWEGRETLKAMQEMPGRRIGIIAAGRLLPENRERVVDYTGIRELHGKRIV